MDKQQRWVVRKKGFRKWAVIRIASNGYEVEHTVKNSKEEAIEERNRSRDTYGGVCG